MGAVEKTATAKAEAKARMEVAETLLKATEFEVDAQKLKAEGDRETGLAASAVQLNQLYGGVEKDASLMLQLHLMRTAVEGQKAVAEATVRCTAPAVSKMMGKLDAFHEVIPNLCRGATTGSEQIMAMPDSQLAQDRARQLAATD